MSEIRTAQAAKVVGLVAVNMVARTIGWASGALAVAGDEVLKAPKDSLLGRARSSTPASYYRLGRVEVREMLTSPEIKGVVDEDSEGGK